MRKYIGIRPISTHTADFQHKIVAKLISFLFDGTHIS